MGKPFDVNIERFDPYKSFRFLVYFGTSTTPVAGVSKVTGLKRSAEVIEYRQGGDPMVRKGIGRTTYDPVTLERGVTHDRDFEDWANAGQVLDKGFASVSLKNLRRQVRVELLNEAGQPVHRYMLHRCWVSEYQALPDLDAGANAIALEHVKIENEGWEHDLSLSEPKEV
jgi:phage tail-like protein